MMRFQRRKPGSIAEWLEIVTKGLQEPVREAVRAEVVDQYRQGREAALQAGAHPVEADIFALQELGEPRPARRELLRSHLTVAEAFMLDRNLRLGDWVIAGVVVSALIGVAVSMILAGHFSYIWAASFCIYVYAAVSWIWCFGSWLRWRGWVLPHLIFLVSYLGLLLVAFFHGERQYLGWLLLGLFFFAWQIGLAAHLHRRYVTTQRNLS